MVSEHNGSRGNNSGGRPALLQRPAVLVQSVLLCALILLLAKLAAQGGGVPVCHPAAAVAAAIGPAAKADGGAGAAVAFNASHAAGRRVADPCCAWTPYLLSEDAERWIIDAARLGVPTMVGEWRRQLSMQLALGALEQGIPGDFVETGTYQGGMMILLLKALTDFDPEASRRAWAADSFKGLPEAVAQDEGQGEAGLYAASRAKFDATIAAATGKHGLTRTYERLHVLEGWFNETLPKAPIEAISFLRLDGDLYTSTRDTLTALYDKVSPGGLIYLDDYGSFEGCKAAVDEFREKRRVRCPLLRQGVPERGLDVKGRESSWEAAWWMKPTC